MKYKIIFLPQVKLAPVELWVGKQYKQEVPLLIITHSSNTIAHRSSQFSGIECSYTTTQRSLHTLQKKTVFKVSIFGKYFHIFLFFLHCTLISELLSLDEGCRVFSQLVFPGEKYFCYFEFDMVYDPKLLYFYGNYYF